VQRCIVGAVGPLFLDITAGPKTRRRDADAAKGLTLDEARRIASNIAKLPKLLGKEN
jgi:hypothetical protein